MLKYLSVFCISLTIGHFAHAGNTDDYYLRGNAFLKEGQYKEAIKAFDAFILSQKADVNPERTSEAHYLKAAAYHAIEAYSEAVSEYKKAITYNDRSAQIYNALGITYSEQKQYLSALDVFKKASQLDQNTAEPYYNIGLVYLKQGDFSNAVVAFKTAVSTDENMIDAYNGLAEAYLKLGLLKESERAYANVYRLQPNNISGLLGLGKVYTQQGVYDQALRYIKRVITLHPDNTEAHFQLAQIQIRRGHKEKAAQTMKYFKILRLTDPLLEKAQKWVNVHQDDVKGYNNLGIVYLTRLRFDKAIEYYQHAIAISSPTNKMTLASTHYNLGLAFHRQKNLIQAIDAYKKAISLNQSLAIAHNNLAVCYTELQRNLDKALTHARTATNLEPDNANYWDTLATIYAKLGLNDKEKQARKKQTAMLEKAMK